MDVTKFFGRLFLVFLVIGASVSLIHSLWVIPGVLGGLWAVSQIAKRLK